MALAPGSAYHAGAAFLARGSDMVHDAADDPGHAAPPALSVVIPLYNRAAGIGAVLAGLRGRYGGRFEVIVVDDGSRDGSADAARAALDAHRLEGRVITQANGGPGAARNTGARAARGRWLIFHDSDDSWYPWTLDILAAILDQGDRDPVPPALMLFREIEAPGGVAPDAPETAPELHRFPGAFEAIDAGSGLAFGSCNLAMRREVFVGLGGFETTQRYAEDNDLIYRAAAAGPCWLLVAPAMIALSRGLGDHLTGDAAAAIRGFEAILAKARGGIYPRPPTGPGPRDRALAGIATKLVRRQYESGRPDRAWGALGRHAGVWVRAGRLSEAVRLGLAPAFAAAGLRNYRYVRFRPAATRRA